MIGEGDRRTHKTVAGAPLLTARISTLQGSRSYLYARISASARQIDLKLGQSTRNIVPDTLTDFGRILVCHSRDMD